jgi:predicted nucleic acid-binding protein
VQTNAELLYLDSSGLVKLVIDEPESGDLLIYVDAWPRRVSSELAWVEVLRAARGHGARAVARARRVLSGVDLVPIQFAILDDAAELGPATLRSLDAIHLAAAQSLRGDLGRLVTYYHRMATAARALGIEVDAPGA